MSSANPLVSIVLVTFNSESYLVDCLTSIANITYKPYEVIVIDNNSSDKSIELIEELNKSINKTKLLKKSSNLGYARAVNEASKSSKGKYLFILNPDTVVTKGFLEPLIEVAENNMKVAAVQPAVYLLHDKKKLNLSGKTTHYLGFDWIKDLYSIQLPKEQDINSFSGSGVLLNKKVFLKLRGYDEKYFMYYEDTDLSWRLRLMGKKIIFSPKSKIYHDYKYEPNENYQKMKDKLYFNERNRIITLFKNYSTKTLLIIAFPFLLSEAMMNVYAVLKGWWYKKIKGYLYILANLNYIISERRKVQKMRLAGDEVITKDFESELTFRYFNIPPVKYLLNPFLRLYWRSVKSII